MKDEILERFAYDTGATDSGINHSKEDIKEYYIQALQLEPKLLIDYLIQEIKVFEDKIEITFNSPIKTSPDNNQGFFVAEFTSKLPQYIQNKTMPNFKEVEIKIYV